MKKIYYVVKAGEVQGPVSPQELEILYREGQISASTQICEEGSDNWKPYGEAGGAVTDSSKSQAIKISESKSSSKTTQTEQPSTNKAKFKGITQWQGTLLIFLIFIGITPHSKGSRRIRGSANFALSTGTENSPPVWARKGMPNFESFSQNGWY